MSLKKIVSRNYILLCANNYFQFMAHFTLMAALPIIATNVMGASKAQVGLINGMYLLGALISRPLMGHIIDIYNKKKILMITFFLFLIPFILYFYVASADLLIALRLLHGFMFGALSTATMTSAASTLPKENMGEGIGYFAVFMTLGMILGPLLGLTLLEYNYSYVFASCLFCVVLIFAAIILLRGNLLEIKSKKSAQQVSGWHKYFEPAAIPIGIIAGLTSLSFSSVSTFITLYADHIGQLAYAPYFYIAMAVVVFFTRPRVGKAFDIYGPNVIIYSALLIFATGLLLVSVSSNGFFLVFTGIIVGLGNGNLFSSLQALVITVSPASRTGVATSTYFICFDGCAALGAILFGPVVALFGFETMFRLAALILVLDCFVYHFLYQKNH